MSEMGAPAALVMARAPRAGRCKTRLEPLLGPDGCARLQAGLTRRAARWAHAVAPGRAYVAFDPPGAEDELRALVPAGTRLFAQSGSHLGERLADAAQRVFGGGHAGTLLIVATDLPRLAPSHAAHALRALALGSDVALGAALDGGYYLIAVNAPHPELFALPEAAWGGPDVAALTRAAARAAGLRVAALGEERDLDTPDDARAVLADPSSPRDVVALLRR